MRLRKRTWLLVVLGALGMMQTVACGTGEYDLSCSTDRDCLESEICHPDELLCVQLCTTIADCPATAKSCVAMSEADESSQKICKCLTEECVNKTNP
jgi:hypothetical protein